MPPKDRKAYESQPIVRERQRARDKERAVTKKWYQRKSCTGFTKELWDRCFAAQEGKCAICSTPLQPYHGTCGDHEHGTKPPVPRGLLCMHCNLALGHYEKRQRPAGLVLPPYDAYLKNTTVRLIG